MRPANHKFFKFYKTGDGSISYWPRCMSVIFAPNRYAILGNTWPCLTVIRNNDRVIVQFRWLGFISMAIFGAQS